mmetsp:Transcript_25832/g.74617  ORF Transcript_25832/g.74617 Transcript_25832/m.74617 type:complete len:225 (+) Transcript_25832:117-791(+)
MGRRQKIGERPSSVRRLRNACARHHEPHRMAAFASKCQSLSQLEQQGVAGENHAHAIARHLGGGQAEVPIATTIVDACSVAEDCEGGCGVVAFGDGVDLQTTRNELQSIRVLPHHLENESGVVAQVVASPLQGAAVAARRLEDHLAVRAQGPGGECQGISNAPHALENHLAIAAQLGGSILESAPIVPNSFEDDFSVGAELRGGEIQGGAHFPNGGEDRCTVAT